MPRYGPDWEQFIDSGPVYLRIDADRMFTFQRIRPTLEPLPAPGVDLAPQRAAGCLVHRRTARSGPLAAVPAVLGAL